MSLIFCHTFCSALLCPYTSPSQPSAIQTQKTRATRRFNLFSVSPSLLHQHCSVPRLHFNINWKTSTVNCFRFCSCPCPCPCPVSISVTCFPVIRTCTTYTSAFRCDPTRPSANPIPTSNPPFNSPSPASTLHQSTSSPHPSTDINTDPSSPAAHWPPLQSCATILAPIYPITTHNPSLAVIAPGIRSARTQSHCPRTFSDI